MIRPMHPDIIVIDTKILGLQPTTKVIVVIMLVMVKAPYQALLDALTIIDKKIRS